MEIPENLKNLYNHWQDHAKFEPNKRSRFVYDNDVFKEMISFSSERMRIWEEKVKNLDQPYTNNQILQKYRFCNIYRELDTQTIEIHQMLKRYTNDFLLWLLNTAFCRFVCKPETIKKVGYLSFDSKNNQKVFNKLMALQSPKFGSAYIFPISLIQKGEYPTREKFFCFYLPKIIKNVAEEIIKFNRISVANALDKILPIFGFNFKFHWTEILIDTAYQYPKYIDLYKKFPIGPGSMPTMKLLNRNIDSENVCLNIAQNQPFKSFPYLTFHNKPIYLSAENIEGIGCEYRKYTNLKNGGGRKRIYKH